MTAEGGERALGEIIAVGARPAGGGRIELVDPPIPGEPSMRWASTAHTIDDIEKELARIWAQPDLVVPGDDERGERGGRHIAARTSVMNLVVIARRPEIGERSAETISRLTGRHPSRTLIVLSADPDGPPWLDARIQAHCVLPRADAPETCSEQILLTAGGETGRHLSALVVAPAHPRPAGHGLVAGRAAARVASPRTTLLAMTDRLVVDGSSWTGDGLARLAPARGAVRPPRPAVDPRLRARPAVALARGDRRRSSTSPSSCPYLAHLRRVSGDVRRGLRDRRARDDERGQAALPRRVAGVAAGPAGRGAAGARGVAREACGVRTAAPGEKPPLHRGLAARLVRGSSAEVGVVIRPLASSHAARDHAARGAARGPARLGAARRRHRRGRERPRPHLGGRRAGDGPHASRPPAAPMSTCWARRSRRAGATR